MISGRYPRSDIYARACRVNNEVIAHSNSTRALHSWVYCLFSNREGLGTRLKVMGLATIDPHRHKVHTKLYKIPKFGVNRPKSKQDTAI